MPSLSAAERKLVTFGKQACFFWGGGGQQFQAWESFDRPISTEVNWLPTRLCFIQAEEEKNNAGFDKSTLNKPAGKLNRKNGSNREYKHAETLQSVSVYEIQASVVSSYFFVFTHPTHQKLLLGYKRNEDIFLTKCTFRVMCLNTPDFLNGTYVTKTNRINYSM